GALLRPMAAMGADKVAASEVPQPEMEGHVRLFQIVAHPAAGFEQHLLHHIAGIEALGDARVQPQADHAPHRLAMLLEQTLDGVGVPLPRLIKKLLSDRRIRYHTTESNAQGAPPQAQNRPHSLAVSRTASWRRALCMTRY